MATVAISLQILAPITKVFRIVGDPSQFALAVGGVTSLEYLGDIQAGVGTRFRQTRVMAGKAQTMDFEIVEFKQDKLVRIVNETHGTIWDSTMQITPSGNETILNMHMTTRTRNLLQRMMIALIVPLFVRSAVKKDFEAVKRYCEQSD